MGQHLSDAPCDIAILTFDLAGDGPTWRYWSSSSICTPSLKFIGLSVQKIWGTSLNILSAWWPWPLTLKLVHITALEVDNLPTNFGVSGTFHSRLIDQHLSDASHDLAILTFDLGGHGTCCWCGSSCAICVPKLNFVGLPVRKILHIYYVSISRPGDLDLWGHGTCGWYGCTPSPHEWWMARIKERCVDNAVVLDGQLWCALWCMHSLVLTPGYVYAGNLRSRSWAMRPTSLLWPVSFVLKFDYCHDNQETIDIKQSMSMCSFVLNFGIRM